MKEKKPVTKKIKMEEPKSRRVKQVRLEEEKEIRSRRISPEPSEEWEEEVLPPAGKRKKKSENHGIMLITYFFVAVFLGLIGNMVFFVQFRSDEVINSSYNYRESVLAERVVRGSIVAKDGEVLAETKTSSKGKETRVYPYKNMFAHVVGRFSKGKTGIEASSNLKMLTSHDNALKNAFLELSGEKVQGDTIVTTLDYSLQKAAYDALGSRQGAVVVMEPDTGKILAMVSKPDYDPNTITDNWERLNGADADHSALLNRVTQGLYPPGSTFKVLTVLAYIRQNSKYKDFSFDCDGSVSYAGVKINCYNQKKHGDLNLKQAFAKSCNGAFASMGMELDMDQFHAMCEEFLFNQSLPTALMTQKSSFELDGSSEEKEIPQTVIGQGKTLMTPLHNAMIACTIANGGVMMKPYVIDRIESSTGNVVDQTEPEVYASPMTSKEAKTLTSYMKAVVTDGTAYGLQSSAYSAAGKTGSAEYNESKDSHAWFIGFAPAEDPEIAICVIVEGAGAGSDHAVPIARKVFDTYFK